MQHAHGFTPAAAIHQIVPIRNDVVDRTAGMAEGHPAIHAARALLLQALGGEVAVNFKPVVDALRNRAALRRFALVFQKAGALTHARRAPERWQRLPSSLYRAQAPAGIRAGRP